MQSCAEKNIQFDCNYSLSLRGFILLCSSTKNQYPPHGRSLEIPRGKGDLTAKFLEAMYENKLEFPGGKGGGMQNIKPSVGGV